METIKITHITNDDDLLYLAETMPMECVDAIVAMGDNTPSCKWWSDHLGLTVDLTWARDYHNSFGIEEAYTDAELPMFVLWCAAYDAIEFCNREA